MNIKLFVTAAVFFLLSAPAAMAESYSVQHDAVKERFQGPEEKTAKDATWTSPTTFKVGVIDDGTPRDGYAEYVCLTLYDYGFKGKKVMVRVIDIVQLTRNDKWVNLGTAYCQ
jgi:hypothetical protein